jgi:hypothetical protein
VVVTFGGGARNQETFAPEGQENIPNLLKELIPQATFFTQVVNRGILGHYVATASLATGVYESVNNFASLPPEHPTVFEYFRKDLKRPAVDAWVVAPFERLQMVRGWNSSYFGKVQIMHGTGKMFGSFQLALHKGLVDDHLGRHIREFTLLPGFHLLSHRLEVSLHSVNTNRDAVDQRERLRVFCEHWRKHACNNVS